MTSKSEYDVLIVGAGIAGSALAHALSASSPLCRSRQFRVALLERSLSEPDRIVGELLQPGGIAALKALGLDSCVENIGAIPAYGYCVTYEGKKVQIPYPQPFEGRSFHHGRLIQALRAKAKEAIGVDVIEATVTELVECQQSGRITAVRAKRLNDTALVTYSADLIVIADGCFSNFRSQVFFKPFSTRLITKGYFFGAILENVSLPIPEHGTVALVPGSGPVLLYQIDSTETRILMDIKAPLPSDIPGHIRQHILPALPSNLHQALETALEKQRLRRMPNSFLPPMLQGEKYSKDGVILLGDAWNMRHPLTGGGMTVAFNDVLSLAPLILESPDFSSSTITSVLKKWHWSRKPLASTVNILSVALYDLFGADGEKDENLAVLREGCFKYFELGGKCVSDPVSLLAGPYITYHNDTKKVTMRKASVNEYPLLCVKGVVVIDDVVPTDPSYDLLDTIMLRNVGSTARDFLAFERNFLVQCRFGLLLSLLSSSFLLRARLPSTDPIPPPQNHIPISARLPFGYLFFVSGFLGVCLALQLIQGKAFLKSSNVITAPKRVIAAVKASIERTGANEPSIARSDAFLLGEDEFDELEPEPEAVAFPLELLEEGDVLDGVAAALGAVMDAKLGGVAERLMKTSVDDIDI
ncbi:hypothetical protein Clacol_006741 [Clathrus columnatus]|uniref:squalene monooxygenase n=1 Tax=Clathrus columnatus TaxID=1419009 RepID=A0AAV5AG66_9AGAM|nr:hypothetical protein Clacol_006741 [Clathrus columnatus]